jgi:hypothetical protein
MQEAGNVMGRTFKAGACSGHVFKCGIRRLGSEEPGQLEGIYVRESGFSESRLYVINVRDKLGMGFIPVWRGHAAQVP